MIKFPRGGYGSQPNVPQGENCHVVHSSTGLWHHVRGPRPTQGPDDLRISRPTPFEPRLRKVSPARNTFKGLCGKTSSGRLVLVPSDPLEQLNGALARANPQKAEPRSCMVLRLKPIGKLITLDKYLNVRLN